MANSMKRVFTDFHTNFYDPRKDGVTQGLLNMWRDCREKAWLYLQGWSPRSNKMYIIYGHIIHAILEKAYEDIRKKVLKSMPSNAQVQRYIKIVEKLWEEENPRADKEALEFKEMSFMLAEVTIPIYFEYWHKDFKEMQWLGLESQFDYTHKFPKEPIRIRGKMDGLYQKNGLWLFETKVNSRIDEGNLVDALTLDFQLSLYLWVVWRLHRKTPRGSKYNIIRRILLEQRQKETTKQFVERCEADIRKRPDFYFIRYQISVSEAELKAFEVELMNQLSEFLDWWDEKIGHYKNPSQCLTKYGRCHYLSICVGEGFNLYEKRKQVFRELEDF